MTPEQFRTLAAIYGANLKHWPGPDCEAAQKMAALPELQAALDEAAMLDTLLASHEVAPPSRELAERLAAKAMPERNSLWPRWAWLSGVGLSWRTGMGLAGAGLAGALAGIFCVSLLTSAMQPVDSGGNTTDYIDYGQDWR